MAAAVWDDGAPLVESAPVARLSGDGSDLYILPDASLETLQDGPGLFAGVAPGEIGLSVIAGHRETHFAFLEHVAVGDVMQLSTPDGQAQDYVVADRRVVDGRTMMVGGSGARTGDTPRLMLVTCWPFDSTEIGPERLIVTLAPASAI